MTIAFQTDSTSPALGPCQDFVMRHRVIYDTSVLLHYVRYLHWTTLRYLSRQIFTGQERLKIEYWSYVNKGTWTQF